MRPFARWLRLASLSVIAQDVQDGADEARRRRLQRLTDAQRAEFLRLDPTGDGAPESGDRAPDSLTDGSPMFVPFVDDGRLYLAGLGHFTIGWRYFGDWQVTFDAVEDERRVPQGAFAVGVTKGRVVEASVTPLQPLR